MLRFGACGVEVTKGKTLEFERPLRLPTFRNPLPRNVDTSKSGTKPRSTTEGRWLANDPKMGKIELVVSETEGGEPTNC